MLFNKPKKEEEDKNQINAVKQNASLNLNSNQSNLNNDSAQQQNTFINPFANKDVIEPSDFKSSAKNDLNPPHPSNTNTMLNNTPQSVPKQESQTQTNVINVEKEINSILNENQNQSITQEQIQELIDETVEKVIDERWNQLISNVEKIAKWKEQKDEEINLIKEDIVSIKNTFEKLEKKIFNKINDYDRNILDVNSEIRALEKVFQKITPTLINNVNELSKITQDLKEIKNKTPSKEEEENQTI